MADEYNAGLANEQHRQIMAELAEIKAQTLETNGRLRAAETDIAVLKERNPGKQGGTWGALAGAIGGLLSGFLK